MKTSSALCMVLFMICLFRTQFVSFVNGDALDEPKTYIVYMGDPPKGDISVSSLHTNMLHQVGSNASTSLLYSYGKSFNGFAAKLTQEEKHRVSRMHGVVSVFPNKKKHLHTTKSWDFMGFPQQVNRTTVESDIIIGVLDTGIWPESDSFNDTGFGPPPRKWKGACQSSSNFTCNNKIIGARYYRSDGVYQVNELKSPRDSRGHGSHTASVAAGGLVSKANLMGFAQGTARGGVPSARIAVYKVCWLDGCDDSDILAAFDDAIADGVDLISLSVGGSVPNAYFDDSIAIGTFHAMQKGILSSVSAGNDGPELGSVTNVSPWMLTVAASTIDRKFVTKLQLGNGMVYEGVTINTFDIKNGTVSIVYGGSVPNTTSDARDASSNCIKDSLDSTLVKGKIVLCDELGDGLAELLSGAAGTVMRDRGDKDYARLYPLPATYLGADDGATVFNYINSTRNPTATILKSNEVNDTVSPYVASFSSRGPNPITFDILKPDLTAPGVEILAAYSPLSPLSGVKEDKRRALYNIRSGTSMAAPHVTAVAAYVKSFHPSWSPAAIKSALMTTAYPLSTITSPDAEFAYGAGHIDPLKALNPGLVYDVDASDYIKFLCGQGYNTTTLRLITGDNSTCTKATTGLVWDLNLPSFALSPLPLQYFSRNFSRTVTNVGSPVSTYNVTITSSDGLKIHVEPRFLSFTSLGQKLHFKVRVEGLIGRTRVSAALVWDDGTHKVRSPIVVYTQFS